MSGKKIVLVATPIVVAGIALAAVFAFPSQQYPVKNLSGNNDSNAKPDEKEKVVAAGSSQDCSAISGKINTYVVFGDGMGTNETRRFAAEKLVDQYCQRPALVQEISAMVNPGLGLVAYACDATSGKAGDTALQESLAEYAQVYCESALFVILDESEVVLADADDRMDALLQQADNGEDPDTGTRNTTAINIEDAKAKLHEASDLARSAMSKADSGQYYEAAKSLDRASKLLEQI